MSKTKSAKSSNKYGLGDVPASWTWISGGPLKGCVLARERHRIVTWDDSNNIYLLDVFGELLAQTRVDKEVVAVAAADTGDAYLVASRTGRVYWLGRDLDVCFETQLAFDVLGATLDSYGYFAAISGTGGQVAVLGRDGKRISQFETRPPVKYLSFIPKEGQILGAADHGLLGLYDLVGRVYWETRPFSNTGDIAIDGNGQVILLACFGHGLIRYGEDGEKEGTYRTDASPNFVAVDFAGRKIVCTTLEQTLVELTYEGSIVATKPLHDAPVGLSLDALGRYAVVAFQHGELRFFMLDAFFKGETDQSSGDSAQEPTWEIPIALSLDEADSAVLKPTPQGDGIALYTNRKTVRIFDNKGELKHESVPLTGVGRSLWSTPTWMAASSDVNLLAYDPSDGTSVKSTLPLYEVSHVEPLANFGEFIIIQSCEFVNRVILPDTEVWRSQLDHRMESSAAQPDGRFAVTLEDKSMRIFDGEGKKAGKFKPQPKEALLVVAIPNGWATLGRRSRIVRGHELDGKLLWSFEAPWAVWGIMYVGDRIVVTGVDGASMLISAEGDVLVENVEPRQHARYVVAENGRILRAFAINQTAIVTDFAGKPLYRWTADGTIKSVAAAKTGVWVIVGKRLAFYPILER